jgi:hypothetical protein
MSPMGRMINEEKIVFEKFKGKKSLGDLDLYRKTVFK